MWKNFVCPVMVSRGRESIARLEGLTEDHPNSAHTHHQDCQEEVSASALRVCHTQTPVMTSLQTPAVCFTGGVSCKERGLWPHILAPEAWLHSHGFMGSQGADALRRTNPTPFCYSKKF